MKTAFTVPALRALVGASALCAAAVAVAQTTTPAAATARSQQTISQAVHDMARDEVQATFRADRQACEAHRGNAQDVCNETVKGREKVAMAHLRYQLSGDSRDLARFHEARYEAAYSIAVERCDDQTGNAKDVCVAQARADRDKARANIEMAKDVRTAQRSADDTKAEADFKVARERCDALSGQAKDACVAGARARYGQ